MSPEREAEGNADIAACVVLYQPTDEAVDNAATYLPEVGRLYVVENTGVDPSGPCLRLLDDPKSELVYAEDNPGIARALNAAAERARAAGYRWLLTMDQDSRYEPGDLARVVSAFRESGPPDDVAMLGTHLDWVPPPVDPASAITWIDTPNLITSGTLLRLDAYDKIGPFDERLFIDWVDFDYCIRARIAGYRNVATNRTILVHRLGKSVPIGIGRSRRLSYVHNHIRSYYITRNGLYLLATYRRRPEWQGFRLGWLARRALRNTLLGGHPLLAARYNLLGVAHYLQGRTGKL